MSAIDWMMWLAVAGVAVWLLACRALGNLWQLHHALYGIALLGVAWWLRTHGDPSHWVTALGVIGTLTIWDDAVEHVRQWRRYRQLLALKYTRRAARDDALYSITTPLHRLGSWLRLYRLFGLEARR